MISDKTTYKLKLADGTNMLLREFFGANYKMFSAFAANYIQNRNDCEDVVQEVFLSFWEQDKMFANLLAVKAYFYTSIRNSCLDILKHNKVREKYLKTHIEKIETTEFFLDEVLKQETYATVYEQINKLPEMEKKVLVLAMQGHSNEEISVKLEIKINTVKTHKARAYKVLRENLGSVFHLFLAFFRSDAVC